MEIKPSPLGEHFSIMCMGVKKTQLYQEYSIQKLCADIALHPFEGLGKPEPLKYQFGGLWSRRIDRKNRLLYMPIDDARIKLISCRGHYE